MVNLELGYKVICVVVVLTISYPSNIWNKVTIFASAFLNETIRSIHPHIPITNLSSTLHYLVKLILWQIDKRKLTKNLQIKLVMMSDVVTFAKPRNTGLFTMESVILPICTNRRMTVRGSFQSVKNMSNVARQLSWQMFTHVLIGHHQESYKPVTTKFKPDNEVLCSALPPSCDM